MNRLDVWLTTGYSITLRKIQFKQVEVQFWDSNLEMHHEFLVPEPIGDEEDLRDYWKRNKNSIRQAFRDYLKELDDEWREEKCKRDAWINNMLDFTSPYSQLW